MKLKIPRFVIIIAVIAFVGLGIKFIGPGLKGAKYLIAEATEIKPSEDTDSENAISKYNASKSTDGTDQLIKNALLKVKDSVEIARGTKVSSVFAADSFSNYQMVIKDNLFRKLGTGEMVYSEPVVQERPARQEPEIRRDPPGELVLTGVVNLGDQLTALVEDASMKKAYFLVKGDKLKDYTIEGVNDQSLTLVKDESKIVCNLGKKVYYNKDNGSLISDSGSVRAIQTTSVSRANTVNTNTDVSSSSPDSGSSSNLSLIEQMKARRRKELEKQ